MYGRFAWALRGFLRETITLEDARAIIRERIEKREENFLRLVEQGIFGYPRSPYLPLLKLAQVELGDIQNMVRDKGLEDTLRALRVAEVYFTFEEYKGRQPVVRHGQEIKLNPKDFDNPFLTPHYYATSGGTTGIGTRTTIDLDHLAAQVPHMALFYEAQNLFEFPEAAWYGVLPDDTGLRIMLYRARFKRMPERWFTPLISEDLRPALKYRLATEYIIAMGRLSNVPIRGLNCSG